MGWWQSTFVAILVHFLATCESTTSGLSSAEKNEGSNNGCEAAGYMLENSIPRSCNAALNHITASLPNASLAVDNGDICSTYCLTPLKQAALECPSIADTYAIISARCCRNSHRERCFDLSGTRPIREVISQCQELNITTENCTLTCSEAIASAQESVGCCLHALLTGSDHQHLLQAELWSGCGQDAPGTACTWCSAAAPLWGSAVIVSGLVTLTLVLVL